MNPENYCRHHSSSQVMAYARQAHAQKARLQNHLMSIQREHFHSTDCLT